ncbi:D-alanyl-D-alanine carboxypeptidase family protein [Clostridium akagii]|uniref:D-alanyl-D-alanine carboxypeptidase family protein n=1 Tax=Clostridium akagii TaxID=91623 RepID=UPI00047892E2|nr:D-alanyl-D-alanine carboxypeptidase family protein [Clostridium akagii]
MKKVVTVLVIVFLVLSNISIKTNAETLSPPNVSGDGIVLMDATTGEILYGKNIDEQFHPASTTKIMTALLTIENTKSDDIVTLSNDFTTKNHTLLDGNTLCLQNGEQLPVKDLLYGLLLRSANDSAVALADHISGSVPAFAKLMNERAKELGCTNTNFQNPNGLYDKDHLTSAKDLALILKKLSTYPEFKEIATTTSYKISPTNKTDQAASTINRTLRNENKLVYKGTGDYCDGIDGGKTGYTTQSLHSYVAAATRNGHRLIVTIMHSDDQKYFVDAKALFDYGFTNFNLTKEYSTGDIVTYYKESNGKKIPLIAAEDFYYTSAKDSTSKPSFKFINNSIKTTKFHKGQKVTNIDLNLDGKLLGNLNLLSGITYSPSIFSSNSNPLNLNKTKAIYLIIGIFVLLYALVIYRKKKLKGKKFRDYYK